jgi:hypothetical protein
MSHTSLIRRSVNRVRSTIRDHQARALIAAARAARTVRLRAVAAGAAPPEIAVLECRRGADVSGLFSEVAAVIGFLEHYQRWRHCYAGVRVRFEDGLYLDPRIGPDWWRYYFEPIDLGSGSERVVDPHFHDHCAHRVERSLPRDAAVALVAQYVSIKPDIRAIGEAFAASHWHGAQVIGVHYRGTDKWEDARRVPYDEMAGVVRDAMRGREPCRIFVATDEAGFVDYMTQQFGDRVTSREMFRSRDGRPIDVFNGDGNYQKGLDAVVDCWLLSRTSTLIRTASNLSLCATFFNPRLPDRLLNPER